MDRKSKKVRNFIYKCRRDKKQGLAENLNRSDLALLNSEAEEDKNVQSISKLSEILIYKSQKLKRLDKNGQKINENRRFENVFTEAEQIKTGIILNSVQCN